MTRKRFTIRSEAHPDTTFYAESYEDAAIKFGHDGQMTIEGDDYFVTFEVEDGGVNELDREPKYRLARVELIVQVPVDVDLEEYLNDTTFDAKDSDGRDIYERVDSYEAIN